MIHVDRRGRESLADEQRVFVDCVEDILQSSDLSYAVFFDPREIHSRNRGAYALFTIQTSPVQDLTVSIELSDKAFTISLNGLTFTRKQGSASRFEWWIERRCPELTRMVTGDLRLTQETFLAVPVTSTLWASSDGKWRKLASHNNDWLGLLSFVIPFGLFVTRQSTAEYPGWCAVEQE